MRPTNFNTSLILLTLILPVILLSQSKLRGTITGRVTNAETREALLNVNVFFSYTTFGAATDNDGIYLIENIPPGIYNLVVRHVGYKVETIQIQLSSDDLKEYNFRLYPEIIQMEEVQVFAKNKDKIRQYNRKFNREFIGETQNARSCRLLNPEVLNYSINPETRKIIAFSDSILRVENRALGYLIDITLDTFEFNIYDSQGYYIVYPKFKEIEYKNEKELNKWLHNRRETYKGSLKHFLSTLVCRKMKDEDFKLYWYSPYLFKGLLSPDALTIIPEDSSQYVKVYLTKPLDIEYGSGIPMTSTLRAKKEYILTDSLGNIFNERSVSWIGYWGTQRLADTLPWNYTPDN